MNGKMDATERHESFIRLSSTFFRIGLMLGVVRRTRAESVKDHKTLDASSRKKHANRNEIVELEAQLRLSRIGLTPLAVLVAARAAGLLLAVSMAAVASIGFLLLDESAGLLVAICCPLAYWLGHEVFRRYPELLARKRAARLLKESTGASNLMMMSLRQDPSLSRAICFASKREGEFSKELRQSIWDVVMGSYSSFEESLLNLGDRWQAHAPELKSSIASMITASSENSEEGRRRALDRANSTMVAGAKRRIEEYALSLSTPSMILFALGILLPIMVGAFLPILSWDLWSMDGTDVHEDASGSTDALLRTAFFMNVLFPAAALLIAANAVSGHPLTRVVDGSGINRKRALKMLMIALTGALLAGAASLAVLEGALLYVGMLASITVPLAGWLIVIGDDRGAGSGEGGNQGEDDLFKVGSRMLEGENLESAMATVAKESMPRGALRKRVFRTVLMGADDTQEEGRGRDAGIHENVDEALRIVHDSAYKDESSAGLLAMDLATYVRDLRGLDSALRSRLKPTVSMMRTTTNFLGPIVLGITYVMYLTLSSMMPGGSGEELAGAFLLILGVFLAEINMVVVYFVWGIEGGRGTRALAWSMGVCVLMSELVFVATSVLAS